MFAWILLIIGGLNWGLVVFGLDLGNWIPASIMTVVYVLVGLSAVYELFSHRGNCRTCMSGGKM